MLHAYLMVNGMHFLNMLDCAHFGVCILLGLILEILRRQTLLGKHLLSLISQRGLGVELAGNFRTHHLLIHKLPRVL